MFLDRWLSLSMKLAVERGLLIGPLILWWMREIAMPNTSPAIQRVNWPKSELGLYDYFMEFLIFDDSIMRLLLVGLIENSCLSAFPRWPPSELPCPVRFRQHFLWTVITVVGLKKKTDLRRHRFTSLVAPLWQCWECNVYMQYCKLHCELDSVWNSMKQYKKTYSIKYNTIKSL